MNRFLCILMVCQVGAIELSYESFPLEKMVWNDSGKFVFSEKIEFKLLLYINVNDGSYLYEINNQGKYTFWEKTNLGFLKGTKGLLEDELMKLLSEILTKGNISEIPNEYHADVDDGCQWWLEIEQRDVSKRIYFNNHFPLFMIQLTNLCIKNVDQTKVNTLDRDSIISGFHLAEKFE